MTRKKRRQEEMNRDRWLVSYADFITLLFAFFVVLYSSAQIDKRRVGQLALAIQVAFQKMGIFDASNTKPAVIDTEPMPFSNVQMVENLPRLQTLDEVASPPRGDLTTGSPRLKMAEIQKGLEVALLQELQKHVVSVNVTKEGIVVSLREIGFFSSGSAVFRADAEQTLARIVKVIASYQVRIRIEGHTDNVPIHTARFDSNWELSTARATEIIKLFISHYGLAPERLSASGYGEYYPVASNATPEGRGQNRRVDLVILNPNANSGPQLPANLKSESVGAAPH